MDRYVFPWALLLLSGCGATMSSTMVVSTPSPGAELFDCAVDHFKDSGYSTSAIDKADKRLTVRKVDDEVQRSDPTFRRAIDEITFEVVGPTEEGGARLRVIARSLHEYTYRRGPTLQERSASTQVKTAARAVLEKCAPEREAAGP